MFENGLSFFATIIGYLCWKAPNGHNRDRWRAIQIKKKSSLETQIVKFPETAKFRTSFFHKIFVCVTVLLVTLEIIINMPIW